MSELLELILNHVVEIVMLTVFPWLGMLLGRYLNKLKSKVMLEEAGTKAVLVQAFATTAVYAAEKMIKEKGAGNEKFKSAIRYIQAHLPENLNISEAMINQSIEQAFAKMEVELDLKGKKR